MYWVKYWYNDKTINYCQILSNKREGSDKKRDEKKLIKMISSNKIGHVIKQIKLENYQIKKV